MNRLALAVALVIAVPAFAKPAHKPAPAAAPLKLPKFLSFAKGSTELPPGHDKVLGTVKQYLAAHPEVTLLRVEGYYDQNDTPELAETHSSARALGAGKWLVKNGVDCKRLIAVNYVKGGDMREGGAYATFVNVGLKGKPIGGVKPEGTGKRAGDLCAN